MRSEQFCSASVDDMRRHWPYMCIYFMIIEWPKSELFLFLFTLYHNLHEITSYLWNTYLVSILFYGNH